MVFKKGESGNPTGRPRKHPKKEKATREFSLEIFDKIRKEANGDGYKMSQLALIHAVELGDIPDWAMKYFKIAKEISNFQHAKKASIETRLEAVKHINFHMVNQDIYGDIEQIHKKDPALIDNIVEAEFTEILNGEKNALEVVEQQLNKVENDEK